MIKKSIVEVFLIQSKATLAEINKSVVEKLMDKTYAAIFALLPVGSLDLEARAFIERYLNTNFTQHQLKFIIC